MKNSILQLRKGLFSALILLLLILSASIPVYAQSSESDENKVQSPYFIVGGGEETHVTLPLKHTEAQVNIAGVIADVVVRQVYINTGSSPIEAEYVFPGSTHSAVYGMKMKIGQRVIEAKIKEREKAKQEFEKAKEEGKRASLLQQHRPNVFQMNVANIQPNDTVEVELKYTELLVPESGVYEFVYPTVVGPRYADSAGVVKDPWVMNPHTNPEPYKKQGITFSKPTFNINAQVVTGIPIKEAKCISHDVNINYADANNAKVNLRTPNGYEGDRDYVLRYRLDGDKVETGLSLFKAGDENFFLLMMEPPKRVMPDQIPPREYIFIVDVSGSMNGYPIGVSKKLMKNLFANLLPEDKFNVLLFAGGNTLLSEKSIPANADNLITAFNFIDKERGDGSTELLPALKRALALPHDEGCSRIVVIATDGYVTVEREAFDLIKDNLGKANFFPFGIGPSVNRYIIEGMARAGVGSPLMVEGEAQADEKAEQFRKYIQSPVLTGIKVDFGDFKVYETEPNNVPDVFAERPVVIVGKWNGSPTGKITLTGYSGREKYTQVLDVARAKNVDGNKALRYLWARTRIAELSDYRSVSHDEALVKEITELGLKYSLLTEFTSFLAVDNQPVSAPSASGDGAVPEPHEWALIALAMGIGIFMLWRNYLQR